MEFSFLSSKHSFLDPEPMNPQTKSQPLNLSSLLATGMVFLCLVLVGCGPTLSVKKTIDVSPGDIRTVLVDPIGQTQTIKVTAESTTSFSVHIHLAGDENAVDLAIAKKEESDKILDGESGVNSASLTAEIPANKEAVVRFQSGPEKGSISYSISN